MMAWFRMLERLVAWAVRWCAIGTVLFVLILLGSGFRNGWQTSNEDQTARDRYAESPGFNPEEAKRNRERAEEIIAGQYP